MNDKDLQWDSTFEAIDCVVKFYCTKRNYGFARSDLFIKDIMLHKNLLLSFGISSLAVGSTIMADVKSRDGRLRATRLYSVNPPNVENRSAMEVVDVHPERLPARVVWFNSSKNYGFVNPFGSSEDVFIGADALSRSGLSAVETGQALCIQTERFNGKPRVWRVLPWG